MKKKVKRIEFFDGDYAFLSNFKGGVEQKFQAAKSLDPVVQKEILLLTAGGSKRRGNEIKLRPDWDEVKYQVMLDLIREKFARPAYGALLLATGDAELIEGNTWHDNIWGVCVCGACKASGVKGNNCLGEILMRVRSELRSKQG